MELLSFGEQICDRTPTSLNSSTDPPYYINKIAFMTKSVISTDCIVNLMSVPRGRGINAIGHLKKFSLSHNKICDPFVNKELCVSLDIIMLKSLCHFVIYVLC